MKILHVCNQLGLGGTEKNIYNLIKSSDDDCEFFVVALKEKGERFDDFKEYSNVFFNSNIKKLIKENEIDLVHIHRAGFKEEHFLEPLENLKIPVVETNIFANFDNSELSKKVIDLHLLISYDSLNTLLKNANRKLPDWYKCKILYFL